MEHGGAHGGQRGRPTTTTTPGSTAPTTASSRPTPAGENNDGDAEGDACDPDDDTDNCRFQVNPGQQNIDGDAQGDVCDADDDNDGVADATDRCPTDLTADNDADGDGCRDATDADDDGDGRLDSVDNCRLVPDPGQANHDGDAEGDACDADDDNDGVPDTSDRCATEAGSPADGCPVVIAAPQPPPAPLDGDGDGVVGATDVCPALGGATANGCPDIRRTVALTHRAKRFRGRLAPKGLCATRKLVTVFRVKPGRDARIRAARTRVTGRFAIRTKARPGRYYARTRATTEVATGNCLPATSKRLKVRRTRAD